MKSLKRFIAPVMLGVMLLGFGGSATTGSVIRLDTPVPEFDVGTELSERGPMDQFLNRIMPFN